MTEDVTRQNNGRFAKGQSGNAAGARTRARKPLITLEDVYTTILTVAASPTQITIGGKTQTKSLIEVNVWGLASGKPVNRLASKDFLEFVNIAALHFDYLYRKSQNFK